MWIIIIKNKIKCGKIINKSKNIINYIFFYNFK